MAYKPIGGVAGERDTPAKAPRTAQVAGRGIREPRATNRLGLRGGVPAVRLSRCICFLKCRPLAETIKVS